MPDECPTNDEGKTESPVLPSSLVGHSDFYPCAAPGSMTRMVFHFPPRKRNQKHTAMPQMCSVANSQHRYTLPPSHTVRAVGITIRGHARQNVSAVTYF